MFFLKGGIDVSDVLRMLTPQASPDSLRAFLHASKNFYNLYTKRYFGHTDIDGLKYVGTFENFGSEMLFETRKLRMNRPPIEVVRPSEYLSYYFNIAASNFINTYNQQNMVVATLKKDVLLPNHKYTIRFNKVSSTCILRAKAYSNQGVQLSAFQMTYENPIIIIDDETEIELFVQKRENQNDDCHVTWYIQFDEVYNDLFEKKEDEFGDRYIEADLSKFIDIPTFMFCLKDMRMLPEVQFHGIIDHTEVGNKDWTMTHPLLEFGTDGNDITRLYPCVYELNVPKVFQTGYWMLYVHGDFFSVDPNDNRNMTTSIHEIAYVHYQDGANVPDFEYRLTYDEQYVRISFLETLKHDDGTPRNTLGWNFKKPTEGDPEYDGMTYHNPIYAYIELDTFAQNQHIFPDETKNYIPAFVVSFKDKYFHPYETLINNMDVGIHIDFTSDFSDHSVSKKFGVAHDLYEFDGLPKYYTYYMDRTIHHSHIELFAIRDDANERNQHAMDRQTSGLIIDSGVPVNDYSEITDDMQPVIVYDEPQSLRYKTLTEHIVSDINYLSDIVGIDGNHFADIHTPGHEEEYADLPRFIYHGNRHFSTGMIDFDPDMEYARVFVLSNDPITYENNALAKNPKAERTFARICDIPSSFVQLEHIPNQSPTIIIDDQYVRQPASFNESLFNRLWNGIHSQSFLIGHYKPSSTPGVAPMVWIGDISLLKRVSDTGTVINQCGYVPTPQRTISLSDINNVDGITISPGQSYKINDTFGFNIGGIFIKGIVDEVDHDGGIVRFRLTQNNTIPDQEWTFPDIDIPISNFNGSITYFQTDALSGNGSGANIKIEIPQSLVDFTEIQKRNRTIEPDIAYSYIWRPNDMAGVCIIEYDFLNHRWDEGHIIQLTGDLDVGDIYYENTMNMDKRTISSVMLYNNLINRNFEVDQFIEHINGKKSISLQVKKSYFNQNDPDDISIEDLISDLNIEQKVSNTGMNAYHSFISVVPTNDRQQYTVLTWMYDMNASYIESNRGNGNLMFPKFSGMHVDSYDNSISSIKFNTNNLGHVIPFMYDRMHTTLESYTIDEKIRLTDQEPIKLSSMIPTNIDDYPTDIVDPHNGSMLSFNLYRFTDIDLINAMKNYSMSLWDKDTDELMNIIIEKFGYDNIISKYYDYEEKEYIVNNEYREGDLLVYHSIPYVVYAENTTYATNTIVMEYGTRKIYRVLKGYVSATSAMAGDLTPIEYDVRHGYLSYIGIKPTQNTDFTYNVIKAFKATTIDADLADGKIVYIGPSAKRQAAVNYLMENYRQEEILYREKLRLYKQSGEQLTVDQTDPIGGFVPLMDIFHENVSVNGSRKMKVDPLYVFKIDKTMDQYDLNKFRLFDHNIDISEKSLLIIKQSDGSYKKFVFHNNKWEWDYNI